MPDAISTGLENAPYLVLSFLGIAGILKMVFAHLQRVEDERREWSDSRHTEYFQMMKDMGEANRSVIQENTQVLGAVLERIKG